MAVAPLTGAASLSRASGAPRGAGSAPHPVALPAPLVALQAYGNSTSWGAAGRAEPTAPPGCCRFAVAAPPQHCRQDRAYSALQQERL